MNSKTKIFAILLVSASFCELSVADASIFDKIMQKVEKAKNTVTAAKDKVVAMKDKAVSAKDKVVAMKDKAVSAKDKVVAMKDKAVSAKDKVMAMKDEAVSTKDKLVKETKDDLSGLSANAKDAVSKVKEITGKAPEAKGELSETAEKPNISEDKEKDKTAESTDNVDQANEKLENKSDQHEPAKTGTEIKEEKTEITNQTPEQDEAVKLVGSADSEENKSENAVEPEQEEPVFSEEVIAKMDKLIPAKEVIDQLKIISFDGQAITDDDIPYLVERLKKLASEGVKKVSLSFRKTSLSLNGAMKILEGLKAHPQFVSGLTFAGNALGDEGAVSIASNLSNFPMLKYLFFSDMGITGDGAVAILSMVSKMSKNDEGTSIQLIDLSNNQVNDEYLDTLVKCWNEIKDKEQMTLMLQGNPFKNTWQIDIPNNIKLVLK